MAKCLGQKDLFTEWFVSQKKFKVLFARTSMGEDGVPLSTAFAQALAQYGQHWPAMQAGGDSYQMRDMVRVGSVWKGTFGKLRDDAPHVVRAGQAERELALGDDEHLLEKCHFLYKEADNALAWQINRTAGGLTRAQDYLSTLLGQVVMLAPIMNEAELQRVLDGNLYEIDFAYARPHAIAGNAPVWNQDAFNMMNRVEAAHAKFTLRAPRHGNLLGRGAKSMVRQLVGTIGAEKIRVRLTDESDPIELFMAPLRDSIRVELRGRYAVAARVYEELAAAYDRHAGALAAPA